MRLPHVSVVFTWRNETNKSGLFSIHLRIVIDRQSHYYKIQTPRKIGKEEWTGLNDSWITSKHEFAFEINNKIREKKNIIDDLITRSCSSNKKPLFRLNLFASDEKRRSQLLFDYMDRYIKKPPTFWK